ncbi:MAG TPA: CDP-alcohol phosphatidyltransferase family protein [Candidatus Limnocylindrales bacterium]|nr:CDP-alcohol phosphatidyltransferase family protein [Candidatus Limnocylindrales bacterium]
MTDAWKEHGRSWFLPIARWLAARKVTPDALTIAGLAFSLLAAMLFARGDFLGGAFVLALTGLCDMLDGDVARLSGTATPFGAFLDSTLDRAGEGALFAGLATYYFTRAQSGIVWFRTDEAGARFGDPDGHTLAVLALATLVLSFLVSYTRARAEGLGLDCKVGIMERPERLLVLLAGAFLGPRFMPGALGVLFLLTLVTVLQRVYHVRRLTRQESPPLKGG